MKQHSKVNVSGKKCVFIGGKQIGADCLKLLLNKNIKPQLVISNMDDREKDTWHESLVRIAKRNKLNLIKGKKVNSKEIIKKIKKINPEIIFCIGATQLIPNDILIIPRMGCLNIHPALLPKYRGRYSTVHAIFNDEKTTGVTLHWMDSGIDSGPIIKQKKITIENTDTARTLYDKFTTVGSQLFSDFIAKWIKEEEIKSKKQIEKKYTYFPKMLPNNGEIDWSWHGKKIFNFIRSMTFEPFPPVKFKIGEKKMVIVDEKYFKGF